MIAALIPAITSLLGTAIDKAVPDKDAAEKLKAEVTLAAMREQNAELEAATKIILAEAQGESWLQRNWRPLTALSFTGCVLAHWLGFTPENLSQESINGLLDIVLAMISGYTLSRSAEKVVKEWKK